jgi:hypothetical protein
MIGSLNIGLPRHQITNLMLSLFTLQKAQREALRDLMLSMDVPVT